MADDNEELSMAEAISAFTGTADATADADANSDDDASTELDEGAEGQPDPDDGDDSESADPDDEGEGEPDEEGQPDDEDDEEAGEGRFAADDHRVRLPDGTFATVAELKAGNLRDRDYRQKTMEVAEARKALEATTSEVTQKQSQVQEQLAYTQSLLQSLMPAAPQRPDVPYAVDPVAWGEYQASKEHYEQFNAHLTYIQQQRDAEKSGETAKQAETRAARLETSWDALLQEAPELKDGKKVDALVEDLRTFGTKWGFTAQELAEVPLDHRQVLVMRKAAAWDKLQAKNKAPTQPLADPKRPPVQKGGKRLNGGDIKARERSDAMAKLNKTGSVKDGIAAYLASQG